MMKDLDDQLGVAYGDYGAVQRQRHEVLLAAVQQASDMALDVQYLDSRHWELTLAARDRLGVLSLIAGLLTSLRIDIIRCDAFTLAPEPGQVGGKILNIFEVAAPAFHEPGDWETLRTELAMLIRLTAQGQGDQAHEEVVNRVSAMIGSLGDRHGPLLPVELAVDNDHCRDSTVLQVSSLVTPGFLFALTNAFAVLQVDIHQARILTEQGCAKDTFWVRDAMGCKIESVEGLQQLRTASVLIKQFAYLLPQSPDPCLALQQFKELLKVMMRSAQERDMDDLHSVETMSVLARFMGVSRSLWEDFLRMQHENLFPLVSDPSRLDFHRNREELLRSLKSELVVCSDGDARVATLNRFKDREIFRADLRHITGRIDTPAFTREISNIAEVVIGQAVELCYQRVAQRWGEPQVEQGGRCVWSILALGKCGGREMGYASDIELMLIFQGNGQTAGPQPTSNQQFYSEVVCLLLDLLQTPKEGIFEIDLRLRPFGKDGPLASSLEAFCRYYGPDGSARQFERMALVKLRPIAGDTALAAEVMQARDAFVYAAGPLDYDNILHLRQRQAKELVPSGTLNAKYSAGGLVDLEYYIQALQIEKGKDEMSLRTTGALEVLDRLASLGHMDMLLAGHVRLAYTLLRRLIDALRVVRGNAKDLSLPDFESRAYLYLARRLNYQDVTTLQRDLYHAMALARTLWRKRSQGRDWTQLTERVLLTCTDTHARMLLPKIGSTRALAWLHGGDFYLKSNPLRGRRAMGHQLLKSFHAKKTNLKQWLKQSGLPVYAVRGNHDVDDPWHFFAQERDISGRLQPITEDVFIAGIGWCGREYHDLPTPETLASLCQDLDRDIQNRMPPDAALIVLSHYPAQTSLCSGFACLNEFLAQWQPVVLIQGHIHEAFGQQTVLAWPDRTQTLVINPGPEGGILTILPEAGTATFTSAR